MTNLESIVVFTHVVEKKSFTAAANFMNVSPSAVSKHVSRLEQSLGVSLFSRSTRNLHLTEAGAELYQRCRRALYDLQDAQAAVITNSLSNRGTLRLHITPGIGQRLVEPALLEFLSAHPDVSAQVTMSPEIVNPIAQGFDLAIGTGSPEDAHMCHSSLSYRDFGPLKYRICAAPSYLRRHGTPTSPDELRRHNCLILSTQVSASEWRFKGENGEYAVPVSGSVVSNSHTLVCGAALSGMGIARLLTPSSADERELDGLTSLFEEQTVSRRIVRAFYPRSEQVPAKVKAFLDFMARVPASALLAEQA